MAGMKDVKTGSVVMVDARKLGQGLKTAFEGMAMVFDSIGAEEDIAIPAVTDAGGNESEEKHGKMEEKTNGEEKTGSTAADVHAGNADDNGISSDEDSGAGDVAAKDQKTEEAAESTGESDTQDESAHSVTKDDVTKIIVRKLKKDRSNNEKIKQILKDFGVAKVSLLPASKYEAFLTELSAL